MVYYNNEKIDLIALNQELENRQNIRDKPVSLEYLKNLITMYEKRLEDVRSEMLNLQEVEGEIVNILAFLAECCKTSILHES